MNELTYKTIADTQLKFATAICEQLEGKYEDSDKGKLIDILADMRIKSTLPKIYEFAQKHPEDCNAITAISKFNEKEIIGYLLQQLKNPLTPHRDLIVERLGELRRPELVKELKNFMADDDRQVRFQAVYALYNIGGKEAALAMCDYISDPDEWISMTILRLLCKMREVDTIPILIEKYHKDTDLRRKALMISFLSRFNSITLLGVFDDALKARDARLRANAIEAIGNLKLPVDELRKRVVPHLGDPNNRIRANSILAIARIAPDKVKNQIIEMCNSDDIQLRRSAAFILCMIPPIDFLNEAKKLIVDENDTVRKRMIQSLKNFPQEFISEQINNVLSDHNKWIRKYAVDMVSAIPGFDATPIINLLRNERSAPNIEACLNFLAAHPTESAMSAIRMHFKDNRPPVVKSLLRALYAINGLDSVKTFAPRLDQHDNGVIQSLTEILLEAGDMEALNDMLSKFSKAKNTANLELLIPSVSSVVNTLAKGEKMPAALLRKFEANIPQRIMPAMPRPQAVVPQTAPVIPATSIPKPATVAIDTAAPAGFNLNLDSLSLDDSAPALPNLEPGVGDMLAAAAAPQEPAKKAPAMPHYKAGVKAYNLGKYKKAIEELRKSVSEENPPKAADIYLGIMLCDSNEYDEAIEHLQKYIEEVPDHSKANYLLGKCYKHKKEWKKLIEVYKRFVQGEIECSPNMKKRIHQDMGTACAILGNNDIAIRLLDNLLKLEPENAEIAYYLAMAQYRKKKISEASVLINQALKNAPKGKNLEKQIKNLAQIIRSGGQLD